jgi:cytochrome bd-type quinol oxidase subunit 1
VRAVTNQQQQPSVFALLRSLVVLVGTGMVGALLAAALMWPELHRRLEWKMSGGGGETGDWGEPLFLMLLLAVPGGLVGLFVGWRLVKVLDRKSQA